MWFGHGPPQPATCGPSHALIPHFTVPCGCTDGEGGANCHQYSTPSNWSAEIANFLKRLYDSNLYYQGKGKPPIYNFAWPMYFEIGNEMEEHVIAPSPTPGDYCDANGQNCDLPHFRDNYAAIFASAASTISTYMEGYGGSTFYILTGGILRPSAIPVDDAQTWQNPPPGQQSTQICESPHTGGTDFYGGDFNISDAAQAISAAENQSVAAAHLGVAVHPYADSTGSGSDFQNWSGPLSNGAYDVGWNGPCFDLGGMVSTWSNDYFPGMPVVFSEDNWDPGQCYNLHPPTPTPAPESNPNGLCPSPPSLDDGQGAYLVDLFTWLYDNPSTGTGSYADVGSSPLRVLVYRPNQIQVNNDLIESRGLYDETGTPLSATIKVCSDTHVGGTTTLPDDYFWLRYDHCF